MNETHAAAPREAWNRIADRMTNLLGDGLIALAARVSVAAIFFLSGRTHLSWAVPMLYLIGRGAGPLSLDRALGVK